MFSFFNLELLPKGGIICLKTIILNFLKENLLYILFGIFLIIASSISIYLQIDDSSAIIIYRNNNSNDSDTITSSEESDSSKSNKKDSKPTATTTVKTTAKPEKGNDDHQNENHETTQFPVDVNYVTKEQLIEINGIGEVTADKIINYRSEIGTIYNMDLLINISGIGENTLEMLKEYLYVSEIDYRDIEDTYETSETHESEQSETVTSADNDYEEILKETTTAGTTTQVTTAEPVMQSVDINKADAEEISEKLLIDIELAQSIVDVREQIHEYTNTLELLYADGMTQSKLAELWDYIII